MNEKELKFLEFVQKKHGDQKRKYTLEPYWTHCLSVSEIVRGFGGSEIEIATALGHDLLEDTDCTESELNFALLDAGYYSEWTTYDIVRNIKQLTDEFTPKKYPDNNRNSRKKAEALRIKDICPYAQTVKCADLIDNTSSIVQHDPGFAVLYLAEKKNILENLKQARFDIYIEACWTYRNAIETLKSKI